MKILQVISSIRKSAGTTTFVLGLSRELVRQGHEVTLGVKWFVSERDEACPENVMMRLLSEIRKSSETYDLVHIHGQWQLSIAQAAHWALMRKMSVVWSPHGGFAPWAFRHKWWKKCLVWYAVFKPLMRQAKLWHSTSGAETTWIRSCGFTQPIMEIPLATEYHVDNRGGGDATKRDRTLLYVGRIYPVKALDRLISAFQGVDHRGWKLRLVGPDQDGYEVELKKMAGPDVEFAGPRFGDDLAREYADCSILALVSHTENFGATVVDALACGKPVLTSTKTPWQEVIARRCGWWVENDVQSLKAVLSEMMQKSEEELRRMGKNGQEWVEERFTWTAVTQSVLEGYRKSISGEKK